jgi:ketosteroid isomerase-like protein
LVKSFERLAIIDNTESLMSLGSSNFYVCEKSKNGRSVNDAVFSNRKTDQISNTNSEQIMKAFLLIFVIMSLFSCKSTQPESMKISKDELLSIVKECDNQFRTGIQKRDSAFITNLYSDSAQYIISQKPILVGKTEIGKEWGAFLKMKEKPIDLILNIKEVRGNREIIYETGQGYTLLADSTKWAFNYVNVWRLQNDGSYKLEIDTYN